MPDNQDDIIDLTELIESGPQPGAKMASASPVPGPADDIDALLAQMDDQDELSLSGPAPASPAPVVDPNEELDMSGIGEVDDLLGSLDIPLEPRKAPPVSSSPIEDELDSEVDKLLDDLPPPDLGGGPAASPPGADSLADDLDALLAESEKPGTEAPAHMDTPDDGGKPEQDADAFETELDSLLGDLDRGPEQAAPKKAQPLKSPDRAAKLEDNPGTASTDAATPGMPDKDVLPPDLDDMLADLDTQEIHASVPPPDLGSPEAQPSSRPATLDSGRSEALAAENALNAELLRQSGQRLDEMGRLNENLARRLDDMSQLNASLAQRLDSMSQMTETLGQRLAQCESELARARAKIEEMEKAETASLEDLLCEGNSLHDRFAALIARSVSEAFRNAPTQTDPAIIERMDNFTLMSKTISARMDAMENRLDLLEPRFNHEVEKAAAMAVVKILREEIARLAQSGS